MKEGRKKRRKERRKEGRKEGNVGKKKTECGLKDIRISFIFVFSFHLFFFSHLSPNFFFFLLFFLLAIFFVPLVLYWFLSCLLSISFSLSLSLFLFLSLSLTPPHPPFPFLSLRPLSPPSYTSTSILFFSFSSPSFLSLLSLLFLSTFPPTCIHSFLSFHHFSLRPPTPPYSLQLHSLYILLPILSFYPSL